MNHSDYTILIVDDEASISEMLFDYLYEKCGYNTLQAPSGKDALTILENYNIDLVLSDINMPSMKGFELLNIVRDKYPKVKRMLMTGYDVDQYISIALQYDIGNIFTKMNARGLSELPYLMDLLLSEDIFGVDRYFKGPKQISCGMVVNSDQLYNTAHDTLTLIQDTARAPKIEMVIVELLNNAIFYGARKESAGSDKSRWEHTFNLSKEDAIIIKSAWDTEKYVISITDNGGRLKKKDVLYWMTRQTERDVNGLPIGILDPNGRGLFLARKYLDRLIINVKRDVKTEVIILNYFDREKQVNKPLYINEI